MARLILKTSAFLSGYGALMLGLLIFFGALKFLLDVVPEILFAELLGAGLTIFGFWALGKYQKL